MLKKGLKGEVALATMILFIALILVASITVGILIASTDTVQTKALTTAKDTTKDIGYSFQVVELYGTDGSDNNDLDYFYWMIKVSSGSESGFYNETMIEFKLQNSSQAYTYQTRYNYTYNLTYLNSSDCSGNISFNGSDPNVLNSTNEPAYFSLTCTTFNETYYVTNANYTVFLNSSGDLCQQNVTVDNGSANTSTANISYTNLTVTTDISGKFIVSTTKSASNSVSGKFVGGDIFQVCLKAPRAVGQDEKVRAGIVPRQGDALRINFMTPAVIRNERIYLYP